MLLFAPVVAQGRDRAYETPAPRIDARSSQLSKREDNGLAAEKGDSDFAGNGGRNRAGGYFLAVRRQPLRHAGFRARPVAVMGRAGGLGGGSFICPVDGIPVRHHRPGNPGAMGPAEETHHPGPLPLCPQSDDH